MLQERALAVAVHETALARVGVPPANGHVAEGAVTPYDLGLSPGRDQGLVVGDGTGRPRAMLGARGADIVGGNPRRPRRAAVIGRALDWKGRGRRGPTCGEDSDVGADLTRRTLAMDRTTMALSIGASEQRGVAIWLGAVLWRLGNWHWHDSGVGC